MNELGLLVDALEEAVDGKVSRAFGRGSKRATATVLGIDENGTVWVNIDGSDGRTPVRKYSASVSEGDRVTVTVEGGRASIDGNYTAPSASAKSVELVMRAADEAGEMGKAAAEGASAAVVIAGFANRSAGEAVQTANDVAIVTLSSTNGTVFKRNLGVSTVIVATVFTPGGRIDNAAELRRRFGAGAYLEWGWRDVVTDASHVLLSSDERIGNGGFTLTVSPDDIDTQAVISCTLNY